MRSLLSINKSIQSKLMFIALITTGSTLLLVGSVLLATEYFNARQALEHDLSVQTKMIATNSSAAVVFNDPAAANEILSALQASPSIVEAVISLPNNKIFAWYQRAQPDTQSMPRPSLTTINSHALVVHSDINISDLNHGEKTIGTLYIGASMENANMRLRRFAWLMFALLLAGVGLSYPFIQRLQRTITGPLLRLTAVTEHIAETKNYSLRAHVETQDEIGLLSTRFNEMLARVQLHDNELGEELRERKLTEERLDFLAHYDPITNLPNRRFFSARVDQLSLQAREKNIQCGLILVDLDNFKVINDNLGHQIGDLLLSAVATRLRFLMRPIDVVSRIGGDEFAILLEALKSPQDTGIVAEKIIQSLASPFKVNDHEIYVHASIGIAICPDDAAETMDLLRLADTAMYHAKERGKNTYQFFLPQMHGKAQKRMEMESGLRHALANGELEIHYQPKYDLIQKKIIGAEALLRWQRPGIGMVGPYDFIPVAEETGLIVPIGEWVLNQVCQQIAQWNKGIGVHTHVAVNLSGRQFKEHNLVAVVCNALLQADIPAQQLELEITESIVVGTEDATIAKLSELRGMDLNISIDDFGTGYSSMSYLKRLPISTLKIDRSFIKDTPGDSDDVAITSAIIAMAKILKLDIVAEGVETQAQIDFLLSQGCTVIQGYFISPPVPAQTFSTMLLEQRLLQELP